MGVQGLGVRKIAFDVDTSLVIFSLLQNFTFFSSAGVVCACFCSGGVTTLPPLVTGVGCVCFPSGGVNKLTIFLRLHRNTDNTGESANSLRFLLLMTGPFLIADNTNSHTPAASVLPSRNLGISQIFVIKGRKHFTTFTRKPLLLPVGAASTNFEL